MTSYVLLMYGICLLWQKSVFEHNIWYNICYSVSFILIETSLLIKDQMRPVQLCSNKSHDQCDAYLLKLSYEFTCARMHHYFLSLFELFIVLAEQITQLFALARKRWSTELELIPMSWSPAIWQTKDTSITCVSFLNQPVNYDLEFYFVHIPR